MENMVNDRSYLLVIRLFCVIAPATIISGAFLFYLKTSFTPEGVFEYYSKKTLFGYTEIVWFHIFSIPLFAMVTLHFIHLFVDPHKRGKILFLAKVLFISVLINIITPYAIIYFGKPFAFVKIAAFLVMEAALIATLLELKLHFCTPLRKKSTSRCSKPRH